MEFEFWAWKKFTKDVGVRENKHGCRRLVCVPYHPFRRQISCIAGTCTQFGAGTYLHFFAAQVCALFSHFGCCMLSTGVQMGAKVAKWACNRVRKLHFFNACPALQTTLGDERERTQQQPPYGGSDKLIYLWLSSGRARGSDKL